MNNEIEYLVSQMNPGQLNAFINQSFPGLVGGNFMFQQGQTEQDKKRIVADKLSKAVASPAMNATQESVVGSLGKYVSPEIQQPQQTRTANAGDYTKFADDSYTAGDNDYADFDSYDDNVSSRRLQPNATKPQSTSQVTLDLVGIQNALAQDPNWQPRNDYEKWVVGQLQGAEWTPNPTVTAANVNRTAGVQTPKAQNEKYQFNVLEDRKNRIAKVQNIPIPKPVGIRTDLQTGLVYDYSNNLVFNPATGVTQKILSKGLVPTSRTIPDVFQGEQSNFIPVPPIESRLDLDPNQDLSPQARQYLVDRQWGKDKEQAYIQQQDAVDNQLTDGEDRFFGTANYQSKRDNSVPYKRAMGVAPRVAGIGQEYSPEVMSRVGQNGFLNNAGSIILPQTWIDKETNERVFSKGRGTATTIIYEGGKGGVAIPKISIPRIEGSGNELVSFEDAVKRQLISPEQYNNYINQASQTKFIPKGSMDSFNRDNVKLYEASDWNPETKREENYRATYINPQSKEVYNVTQNGGFYLVRPGVSKEGSGLPTYDDTTNLAQEMTDINRAMREGGRDNLVDVIRENPDNPGLEAFTRPVPAINPITGETINKYAHSELVERFNPATGQIEKTYLPNGNLVSISNGTKQYTETETYQPDPYTIVESVVQDPLTRPIRKLAASRFRNDSYDRAKDRWGDERGDRIPSPKSQAIVQELSDQDIDYVNSLLVAQGKSPVSRESLMQGKYDDNLALATNAVIESDPLFARAERDWANEYRGDLANYHDINFPLSRVNELDDLAAKSKVNQVLQDIKEFPDDWDLSGIDLNNIDQVRRLADETYGLGLPDFFLDRESKDYKQNLQKVRALAQRDPNAIPLTRTASVQNVERIVTPPLAQRTVTRTVNIPGAMAARRWVDEDNPQELFNYFNANQESQGDSMQALDLARGGRRTAGGKVTPAYPSLQETDYLAGRLAFNASGNIVDVPSQQLAAKGINNFTPASEFYTNTSQLVRDTRTGKVIYDPNRTVYVRTANTGFDDGDFAVVPYKEDKRIARVNQVVPSSSVLPVYSYPYQEGDNSSTTLFNPLLGEKPKEQAVVVGKNNGYTLPEIKSYQAEEVYPGDFTNTQFYRIPTNPETPLRAYKVNEFGNVETNDGVPIEALTPNRGFGLPLPRSAQIANFQRERSKDELDYMRGAEGHPFLVLDENDNPLFVESPVRSGRKISLAPEDWEGVLPDSKSVPEGMSYDEAKDKGLLNPVWDKSRPFTALDGSYQIPLPKGVGLARVLDESDPRTQAAIAAQRVRINAPVIAQEVRTLFKDKSLTPSERNDAVNSYTQSGVDALGRDSFKQLLFSNLKRESKPAFDRKYTITPGRTAGIESPQYAQYTDLKTSPEDDTARFWKENLPGIIPKGVIEGAYLPVTVTPRPVNAEGRKGWLYPDQIYTTESGREVRGDKALNYVNVPLNLDSVRSYLPPGKREELVAKGFDDDAIDDWYSANPNLGRDNALANAKIVIDGQYYDVTPQATVAEFNPVAGGNYAMAEIRSQNRAARIDLPFKAGTNISEPTPEWIQQQAVNGKLNFNADDYISPDDKAILNQKEVYNAGYEEPTDILGAINRTQQKKNRIDAVISNREQRAMNNLNEQVGSVVDGNYTTLSPGMKVFNQEMLANPTDLSSPISENFVGSIQLIPDAQSPTRKTFKGWDRYSNYLGDQINTASKAHNTIVNIEDSPEIVVSRKGTFNQLLDFNERGQEELGLNKYAGDISQQVVGYDKFDRPLYKHSLYGTLPDLLLPYEQAKELNQSRLLPAYRTQQKVKLPTVPVSNVVNLGRVKFVEDFMGSPESILGGMGFNGGFIEGDLIPGRIKTTSQVVPPGNQVVNIVPSSSENYQYRSGGNANYGMWDMPITNDLGGMGFDGGSIPGDYVPRQARTNVQQRVQAEPQQVRTPRTQSPNIPLEPDVRMTDGMNIPKWAIPATLGAVWLGLAANARRQQDEERRQQQGVVNRY